MPNFNNIGLQIRYSEDEDWVDVKLFCIEKLDDGNIRLSYYSDGKTLEFYEAKYEELINGNGTARFIEN